MRPLVLCGSMLRVACSQRGGTSHRGSLRWLLTGRGAARLGGKEAPATGTALARKPIILLDVDGVVNMFEESWVPVEKKHWGSDTHVGTAYNPERDAVYGMTYSKEMVRSINAWNKVAEVQWLTTWNEGAQTHVAPALGLDHFGCARTFKQEEEQKEDKAKTSMRIAKDVGDDTLIIWIDDDMERFTSDGEDLTIFKRPNTLLLCPPGLLTRANIELVNACLADPLMWRGKHLRENC